MAALEAKHQRVRDILRSFERVLVAFSGGVDSTLLAKLARDVLGRERVVAVTADSPSLAREDLAFAQQIARELGLEHLVIQTQEVRDPAYRRNTAERCYVCKRELFEELEGLAQARRCSVVLYGELGDDVSADRPGRRAALERGVRAPLQEAGLDKWDVRELARALGLSNWDRPQNACLSSRIPHGQGVTEEKLHRIEAAESFLRAQGFRQVRVRDIGAHARIEVGAEDVSRFSDARLCQLVTRKLQHLGFATVGVDRRGYRAGGAEASAVDEISLAGNRAV